MDESLWQQTYRREATQLGRIGRLFVQAPFPKVEVRLPRALAECAIQSWAREGDDTPIGSETFEQRIQRHRAGTLALIGLSIERDGRWEGDEMVVPLDPVLVGVAIDASDELDDQD